MVMDGCASFWWGVRAVRVVGGANARAVEQSHAASNMSGCSVMTQLIVGVVFVD